LGTALRASVHIHLPLLGNSKAEFQKIADGFHVQIRGAHGEHTETDDHIYDISNKRRLGRSEVDLVQDMYNGVKAMIEAEKVLQAAQKPKEAPVVAVAEKAEVAPVAVAEKAEVAPVAEEVKPEVAHIEEVKPEAANIDVGEKPQEDLAAETEK
jgi:hypothetical protein